MNLLLKLSKESSLVALINTYKDSIAKKAINPLNFSDFFMHCKV